MCNSNKNKIIQMYYTEHLRPTDIAKALNIDNGYITRIIKQDERYQTEKEQRKQINKQKNKEKTIAYIKEIRHSQKEEYEILQYQLTMDSKLNLKILLFLKLILENTTLVHITTIVIKNNLS